MFLADKEADNGSKCKENREEIVHVELIVQENDSYNYRSGNNGNNCIKNIVRSTKPRIQQVKTKIG